MSRWRRSPLRTMIATTKPASLGTWEFITEPVDFVTT
jgi:hypothetical protein